jgi:tetratricopeptide (TPR) repeat protein
MSSKGASHLWADRFDGELDDIFDLQDQVTSSVVGAIAPRLEQAEIERTKSKPTENLDAYDYYLRGLAAVHQWTKEGSEDALSNFHRAIELDPGFAAAYGMAARVYSQRKGSAWVASREIEVAEAARLARRAVELGKDDAVALGSAGIALSFVVGDQDDAKLVTDRAIALNPNLAWAWLFSGWARAFLGESEAAIDRISRALRLSPTDPHSFSMYSCMAFAHFSAGRYIEALSWAERAVHEKPTFLLPLCVAAAVNAQAGHRREAERALARLRQVDPALRLSNLSELISIRRPEVYAKWEEGLRLAGLPE